MSEKNGVRVWLTVQVPRALFAAVAERAEELEVPRSWVIRRALRDWLERYPEGGVLPE